MARSIYLVIMVTIFIVVSFFATSYSFYKRSFSSTYTYSVYITTNNPLRNATFFIPLPSNENSTTVHAIIEDTISTHDDGFYEIINTEYGTMFKLSFTTIDPHDPPRFSIEIPTAQEINTKNPFDHELLLQPNSAITPIDCQFPHPDWDSLSCFTYSGMLFAEYEASSETNVSISISVIGKNSWWVFGWSGNEYRDELMISLKGPFSGWKQSPGAIIIGFGRYSPFF